MGDQLAPHMRAVAELLLGKPTQTTKHELRYGSYGSLSVDLDKGTWFSHEDNEGGGVLDLIHRQLGIRGPEAVDWMREKLGVDIPDQAPEPDGGRQKPNKPNGQHQEEDVSPAVEQFHAAVADLKFQNAAMALGEKVRIDPGFPFRPETLEQLAEQRRSNLAQYQFARGVFAREGVPVRELDEAVANVVANLEARSDLAKPPPHVDLARLDGELPKRRFIIDDWIPRGHLTSLYGEGSSGKSFLSMILATCLAAGIAWLGARPSRCAVLGFFCEDSEDELLIREHKVLKGLGLTWRDVVERLFLVDRVGAENTLIGFDHMRSIDGPAMADLRAKIQEVNPEVLILDNIAHLYGGNENDRFQVTCFLNRLAGLAREIDGAIVLLGHPPKNLAEYSGSTAWSNNVRSRLWLERCKDDDDRWILKRAKTNYADPCELALVLDPITGLVRPDDPAYESEASRHEADRKLGEAREHIKRSIDLLNSRDLNTAPYKTATNNLVRILRDEEMAEGFKPKVLWRALDSLMKDGIVVYEAYSTHAKGKAKKTLMRVGSMSA